MYNTKELIKNAYRITSRRGYTALRLRVPGGHLAAEYLSLIQDIARRYGNGTVHLTTRQGFEIPGIPLDKVPEVNQLLAPMLQQEAALGVAIENIQAGYPAAGTRNVTACIGSRVCPFANFDTTALAQKIEGLIYPNHYHVKIAITGCPNDCIKAHLQDIGIIGQVEPEYDPGRCIACEACVKNCRQFIVGALELVNYQVERDRKRCLGCGECILQCPMAAWTRGRRYYRIVALGRTGKKSPRLAANFLEGIDEKAVLQVISNLYRYIERHIDRSLPKEHVGYIVDRTGYQVFRDELLDGVNLGPKGRVARELTFYGYSYDRDLLWSK
ncbi:anaerobic sulfite reductase subunit C [Moorella thermoacetica]|uniref:Anaerobic sulfite reductase subunit C n=1 Tax=Neomoorella thermoacetica TaxID=1525 RepID=A0A1J5NIP2_NEOTH|nr:anaerobic sulfite reductase subunit C [Moorella thermoacetica]